VDVHADTYIAIIEMAAASGLALLSAAERDPWQTSTLGTGELMRIASTVNAKAIVLGIGGSATNDLGLGALAALGLEFVSTRAEKIFPPIPAHWPSIARITGAVPPLFPTIRVACDVTNPLLGPNGCAAVYGPQKGLQPADLTKLEEASARLARLLCAHCLRPEAIMEIPGAGAAGGIAFGLMTATDARLLSGFGLTSDWLDLPARIRSADIVVTGEGRFDESSVQGKGPGAIIAMAAAVGKPMHVFAGQISGSAQSMTMFHAITPDDWPLEKALRETPGLLRIALQRVFR
jgi:glycerate kinase